MNPETPLTFGPFKFDFAKKLLLCGKDQLHIARNPLRALEYVLKNRKTLVSYEDLIGAIWGDAEDKTKDKTKDKTADDVRKTVRRCFKALTYQGHTFIQTAPQFGYRFVPFPDPNADPGHTLRDINVEHVSSTSSLEPATAVSETAPLQHFRTEEQSPPAVASAGTDIQLQTSPEIEDFLSRQHLALKAIDEFIELESDERGWTRGEVEFRNVGKYEPSAAFARIMERFKADPPIKGYYSLCDVESRSRDEERKLTVYALESDWQHIHARNEVEQYRQIDPECRKFRIECEKEFMPAPNSRTYRHVNSECLVVSADNLILLGRRRMLTRSGRIVPVFPGVWSATLEEQMLRIDPTGEIPPDKDLFVGAERGVAEELNVRIKPEETRLLSYGIEWGNHTAAFLFVVKTVEDFATIAKAWTRAKDRIEAVALDCIPGDISSIAVALSQQHCFPSQRVVTWKGFEAIARDLWHPTARARLWAYLRHLQYLAFGQLPSLARPQTDIP